MTDLKIQRVGADRVGELQDLWGALYTHHRTVATPVPCAPWIDEGESWRRRKAFYERLFSNESGFALIAEREGDLVGYAAVEVLVYADDTYDTGQPWAELQTLSVAPEYRGSQVGSELLSAAYDQVRPLGIRTMLTGVADGNHGALRFYQRHGYSPWVNLLLAPVPVTNDATTRRRTR